VRRRTGLAVVVSALLTTTVAAQDHASTPGNLDGRPAPASTSTLQARVDAAPRGARIEIAAGTYVGDLIIERPLSLIGIGRPVLQGSGTGSVIRVRAADVTLEGLAIDGGGGGDLARDTSGIHVAGPRVTIRDCHITRSLFGIYLREADGARVEHSVVHGIPGLAPGEKGSGIHVWNTDGFTLIGNEIRDARDGFYIQSSPHGVVTGNVARDLRYGLHYMFSDDNIFEGNTFENAAAGTALMYSKRLVFRRNRFLHNRGFASVGLLFKACDDVVAEDNLIADNARGIFIEGSYRNVFRRNVVAESDTAIVLYDSCAQNRFEGNSFISNMTPLTLVGRRTDTVFLGNYWSGDTHPDLDGDGIRDRPYRLSDIFDHLRGNLTAADLFAEGLAAHALAAAEQTFPVLDPITVEDPRPLARPPVLPLVPQARPLHRRVQPVGLAASILALALGLGMARPDLVRPSRKAR
jgi:nitrous oxidase accessory protein